MRISNMKNISAIIKKLEVTTINMGIKSNFKGNPGK
jgi:hypothetical protein